MKYLTFSPGRVGMRKLTLAVLACMLLQVGTIDAKSRHERQEIADVNQQAITISGTVVDDLGDPVIGANVSLKGSTIGTITDIDGKFILNGVRSNGTLVVSYVGFATQEIPIAGKTTFHVKMATSDIKLEEVVVTALGIKREKKALGYSVAEVGGDQMAKVSQTNVLNSLAGKVAGVQISSVGSGPNSSVSMVIRGIRSLNSDNQPLFVIDGVPVANTLNNTSRMANDAYVDFGNAISDLNPADIENVSILKGPSAAALYGSRAGNGVVLVTTKSGKKAKGLGISVSSTTDFAVPYKFLPLQTEHANGSRPQTKEVNGDYMTISEFNDYRAGIPLDKGHLAYQWNSPKDANGNYIATPVVGYRDNFKNFVQTAITSTNNVAIANESDKTTYRLSYTNTSNKGNIPTSNLFRNTIAMSGAVRPLEGLEVSASVNFNRSASDNIIPGDRNGNPLQHVAYLSPHINIMDMKDYWVPGREGIEQRLPVFAENNANKIGSGNNPWFMVNELKNAYTRDRVFGNARADYKLNNHWALMLRYSHDQYGETREGRAAKSYSNDKNGAYAVQNLYSTESNTDFLASYKTDISDFNIAAAVGGNYRYAFFREELTGTQLNGAGLIVPGLYRLSNIAPTSLRYSNGTNQRAMYSLYGTATVGYKDIAYLDLTARNDWSSTLPKEERSFFYPSASASVLLNNAIDMGDKIDLLKVRAGIAQVGKDVGPYSLYPVLTPGQPWGGQTTMGMPDVIYNPLLKPEIATSWEVGLDLAFFKNRLRFEGTYYVSDNKNQVLNVSMPNSSGYRGKQINAGLIRSNGVELTVAGTPIDTKDWTWDISANFSKNKSYVMELADGVPYINLWGNEEANSGAFVYPKGATIPATGEISTGEIGAIWDRQVVTVTDKNSPYYGWPLLSNDGGWQSKNSVQDKVVVGNFMPNFTMGFQTTLKWKFLSLSASFDWRSGGQFISQTYRYLESDHCMDRQLHATLQSHEGYADWPSYLKSDPDKYIKIAGGNFPVVGGIDKEHGGLYYEQDGVGLFDGVFNPGVIQTGTTADGSPIYLENLGGEGTRMNYFSDNYPWSFARSSLFDADYFKLRELNIDFTLPKEWIKSTCFQNVSVGLFTKNIMLWTKADIGVDPEMAYQPKDNSTGGSVFRQGIERYNVNPWTVPIGIKLNVNF